MYRWIVTIFFFGKKIGALLLKLDSPNRVGVLKGVNWNYSVFDTK